MPWIYHQKSGKLYHDDKYVGRGWAGHGAGKYNPAMQNVQGLGPLPRGNYIVGRPFDYPRTAGNPHGTGPYSMRLTPNPHNRMFGRSGFLIHGASTSSAHYGEESNGCIILAPSLRHKIGASSDHVLKVVE
jgi:hypothetical protein